MRARTILAAIAGCVLASTVQGIVGRHDVELVATPEEAERFAAVCKILPDGEGVLVGPQWVLTAAHVATGPPLQRLRVRVGGIDYRVAEVFPHRGWQPGHGDIALMRLTTPVSHVAPLELQDGDLQPGTVVRLAGRGDFGDGQQGIAGNDGKLRVADNALSEVEAERLFIRLDAPDAGALPAEGVSGPGDSGTPLLLDTDGRLGVVGIGSVGASPKEGRYGEYGSVDVFIRTSHYRDWIGRILERLDP